MARFDTIVAGGTVVTAEQGERPVSLLIKDGVVAGVVDDPAGLDAAEVVDASGCYVLPGAVDPHVHIGIYGPSEPEWHSESCAAAAGGVTTFLHYQFHKDAYHDTVPRELEIAGRQSVVDFGFHLGILTPTQLGELPDVPDEYGITSYKFYMHWKGAERLKAGSDVPLDDGFLYQILRTLGRLDRDTRLAVHSQNVEVSARPFDAESADHFLIEDDDPPEGLELWERLNPGITEAEPALRILYLARQLGAQPYLVHLSSRETIALARELDLKRWNAIGETCIHYLSLTTGAPAGLLAKVNPPVRHREDQDALWSALLDGTLSTVGTDHCSLGLDFKRGNGDSISTKLGFPGMNCLLPVMVTEGVQRRGMSWRRLVEVTSAEAARVFRLYPRKGTLQPGSDADVVIVDPRRVRRLEDAAERTGAADFSVYEGMELAGWPVRTLVRGRTVFDGERICVEPGYGTYQARP